MADFKSFFPTLISHEGGYVNDPADPGGETNLGITIGTFRQYAQKLLNIAPTSTNLRRLTRDQAGVIYKAQYWDQIGGDAIQLQELANMVFDFYVNAGGNAIKVLQGVLNGLGANLALDGKIGPGTRAALTGAKDQREVYRRFKKARIAYYENLAARNPKLKKFLKGWLRRANSFPTL